jgi:23S rRNA (uridine2552-2'-O)-methyltransferase
VLCDAAPKLTGVRATDRAREEALLETVEALLPTILAPGGDLLLKLLESPEAQAIAKRIGARFERSRTLRPKATRKGSSEKYLFGRGYRE